MPFKGSGDKATKRKRLTTLSHSNAPGRLTNRRFGGRVDVLVESSRMSDELGRVKLLNELVRFPF